MFRFVVALGPALAIVPMTAGLAMHSEPPAQAQPTSSAPQPSVTPAPAGPREAVVVTKDGGKYQGELVEQNDQRVVIRVAGIDTPFRMEQVERLHILPPVAEQYRQLRQTVDDNDVEQLLKLTDWLIGRNELDLARRELAALHERQPESAAVQRARTILDTQIELRDKARAARTPPPPAASSRGDDGDGDDNHWARWRTCRSCRPSRSTC